MSTEEQPPLTVSIAAARANWANLINLVKGGTSVYITKRNTIVAVLHPILDDSTEKEAENAVVK